MDEVGGPGGINPQHFQPAEKPAGIDTEIWGGAKSARRGTRPKMTRTLSMANLRGTIRARKAKKAGDIKWKSTDITQMGSHKQQEHSERLQRYGDKNFDVFLRFRKLAKANGKQPNPSKNKPEVKLLTSHYVEKSGISPEAKVTFTGIDDALKEAGFELAGKNGQGLSYFHPESGTTIGITYDTVKDEFCVCCGGLGTSPTKALDLKASKLAGAAILGSKNLPHIDACNKFADGLSALEAGESKITIVGHSHGGAIAQAIGLRSEKPTICFNSRQLSKNERNKIKGDEFKISDREGVVTHYHTVGDPLSPDKGFSTMRRAGRARNVGRTILVPRGNTYESRKEKRPGAHNDYGRWQAPRPPGENAFGLQFKT